MTRYLLSSIFPVHNIALRYQPYRLQQLLLGPRHSASRTPLYRCTMHHPTVYTVAVALLAALPGAQAAIYTKKSPVLQVDGKDYDRLIGKSNKTSVRNLPPATRSLLEGVKGLSLTRSL